MGLFLCWYLSLAGFFFKALNVDKDIISNFLNVLQHFLITLPLRVVLLILKIFQLHL